MFRFTIRESLLVMLVVGLAVGWWLDHSRLVTDRRKALDAQARLQTELDHQVKDSIELGYAVHAAGFSTARLFSGKYFLVKTR